MIVFGDRIQISPGLLAIQAGGVAALVAGVVLVASDPALSQLREQASKLRPAVRDTASHAAPRRAALHVAVRQAARPGAALRRVARCALRRRAAGCGVAGRPASRGVRAGTAGR